MLCLRKSVWTLSFSICVASCGSQKLAVQEDIRVVGSSAAFAYGRAVAEEFRQQNPKFKAPIVESTGTGKGIELFCSGIGGTTPDITFASRRMKKSEFDTCVANGVKDTVEFQIGIDGVILVQAKNGKLTSLTSRQIFYALAATPSGKANVSVRWSDVDPTLLSMPILIYGPSSSSGTRSAFGDLILKHGCLSDPLIQDIKDKVGQEKGCTTLRDDGVFANIGENDDLLTKKLAENPQAIGIAPYSLLAKHGEKLRPIAIEGKLPSDARLLDGSYIGSRPVYAYVKRAHLDAVPGLKSFVQLLATNIGPGQLLSMRNLIVMDEAKRSETAAIAAGSKIMDSASLK